MVGSTGQDAQLAGSGRTSGVDVGGGPAVGEGVAVRAGVGVAVAPWTISGVTVSCAAAWAVKVAATAEATAVFRGPSDC